MKGLQTPAYKPGLRHQLMEPLLTLGRRARASTGPKARTRGPRCRGAQTAQGPAPPHPPLGPSPPWPRPIQRSLGNGQGQQGWQGEDQKAGRRGVDPPWSEASTPPGCPPTGTTPFIEADPPLICPRPTSAQAPLPPLLTHPPGANLTSPSVQRQTLQYADGHPHCRRPGDHSRAATSPSPRGPCAQGAPQPPDGPALRGQG